MKLTARNQPGCGCASQPGQRKYSLLYYETPTAEPQPPIEHKPRSDTGGQQLSSHLNRDAVLA